MARGPVSEESKTPSDRNAVLRVSSPLSKAPPTSDAPSWYVPLLDRGSSFLDARRTRYEVVGNGVRVTRYGYEVRGTVCLMSGSAVRGTCCEVRSTGYLQPGYSMPGVRGTRSEVPASKLCCSRCKKCFTFHDSCSLGNYLSATKRTIRPQNKTGSYVGGQIRPQNKTAGRRVLF